MVKPMSQIVPNNNPYLYCVEPMFEKDEEGNVYIEDFYYKPIVAWVIETLGSNNSMPTPITLKSDDVSCIYDKNIDRWHLDDGIYGRGENKLREAFMKERKHEISKM